MEWRIVIRTTKQLSLISYYENKEHPFRFIFAAIARFIPACFRSPASYTGLEMTLFQYIWKYTSSSVSSITIWKLWTNTLIFKCYGCELWIEKLWPEFLNKNYAIDSAQHGLRKGRWCLTNLLDFLEAATDVFDQGKQFDVAYLDFSTAFDKVPHRRYIHCSWNYMA